MNQFGSADLPRKAKPSIGKSYLLRVWQSGPGLQPAQRLTLISVEDGQQRHCASLSALLDFLAAQEVSMD